VTTFWVLIALTLAVAAADWWAVATDRRQVEYVLKPATMVALIAAAVTLADPVADVARWFVVAGLVCSLAGDVFLMLDPKYFVAGLGSFLAGHVMYVVGLSQLDGINVPMALVGVALVAVAAAVIGTRVVRGAAGQDRRLRVPVALYMAVISLMVVTAFGSLVPAAIIGAVLFYASDGILGWNRFVEPVPHGRIAVMTTYHLGQVGLVLALVS
jgi:uncharacterized membrane protein YhhN